MTAPVYRIESPVVASTLAQLLEVQRAKKTTALTEEQIWDRFHAEMDRLLGPIRSEKGIPAGDGQFADIEQNLKIGRSARDYGSTTDKTALVNALKLARERGQLTTEQYASLVSEQQEVVTTFHVNEEALRAALALNPVVKAALDVATSEPDVRPVRINPSELTKDDIAAAKRAPSLMSAQEAATSVA
jgi:hypothetical protein